jgi:hypothetical protein
MSDIPPPDGFEDGRTPPPTYLCTKITISLGSDDGKNYRPNHACERDEHQGILCQLAAAKTSKDTERTDNRQTYLPGVSEKEPSWAFYANFHPHRLLGTNHRQTYIPGALQTESSWALPYASFHPHRLLGTEYRQTYSPGALENRTIVCVKALFATYSLTTTGKKKNWAFHASKSTKNGHDMPLIIISEKEKGPGVGKGD